MNYFAKKNSNGNLLRNPLFTSLCNGVRLQCESGERILAERNCMLVENSKNTKVGGGFLITFMKFYS